ncbi:hypothetical protein IMG5_140420 [Ichthyophthirius multifiliis]|uniref:RanBP2-type domain-containing protein n=1 Tax=Ichthyophthirius multifiliis TaxID=5932 RepID=G0QXB3_ICHMU|nr:hypothetical protein IMG5_140420 [Ichthyophthirius multifiliis]EGR30144.1 hypothetical protein IMG5_140420 [Ichthyophthirius multifiliis]|eukprot:XP_004031380.1 hypothetical protein IMG5_140420 [Ichthyophthirius multifiliis]
MSEKKSRKHRRSHSRSRSHKNQGKTYNKKDENQKNYTHQQSQWHFTPKNEESKWIIIENLPESITQTEIEEKLTQISADCGTSNYDEIKLVPYLGSVYIQYPSVSAATKTLYHLKGKIKLRDEFYPMDFYNSGQQQQKSSYEQPQTDWICDKCEYKNFAKRTKCNKCEKPRSSNCRVVLNSVGGKQTLSVPVGITMILAPLNEVNTSLMVRGNIIQYITESHLIDSFEPYAKIKDVRLVKNKQNGQQRDFAFVEFYTLEDAERVLSQTSGLDFKVGGEHVQTQGQYQQGQQYQLPQQYHQYQQQSNYGVQQQQGNKEDQPFTLDQTYIDQNKHEPRKKYSNNIKPIVIIT